jgi:hypothetical protein
VLTDGGLRISKPAALNAKILILKIEFTIQSAKKESKTLAQRFRYQTDFTKPSGIFENK